MSEPIGLALAGTMGYVAHQLFGKTLNEMGSDINKLYQAGRDRILISAAKKVSNPQDGKSPNLRVARDVLWNGAVTDSEICAEYFGGILAASRSENGIDDSCIQYVSVIKTLSSKQLHLHYCIYHELQKQLLKKNVAYNPGVEDDVNGTEIWFSRMEGRRLNLDTSLGLPVLSRNGLIAAYEMNYIKTANGKPFNYVRIRPSTYGIVLYSVAFNHLNSWFEFASKDFGSFEELGHLQISANSLPELTTKLKIELEEHKTPQ